MRVIFINRFGPPDHAATSQMMGGVAAGLAKRGHSVRIVTSRLRYDRQGRVLAPREGCEGVEIQRIFTTAFGRAGLVGRLLDYLSFYVFVVWHLLWTIQQGDIVIAKTDPPMLSVVVWPVAVLKRARLVNWIQDLFPEVAEVFLGERSFRAGFSVLRGIRNHSLRAAAMNVVIGERMAGRVSAGGVPVTRIREIPNFSEASVVWPVPRAENALRRDWQLRDAFTVGYSGNLGRAHEADTLVRAAALLEGGELAGVGKSVCGGASAPIVWTIVGGGSQWEQMRRRAEQLGLRSMRFLPYQPRERLAESLSVPDVHLVSLQREMEGLVVPSKYYGIAAAGRTTIFIGAPDGEIARILERIRAGVTVAESDAVTLAAVIEDYACGRRDMYAEGERARRFFEAGGDVVHAVDAWERLLNDLS